VRGGIVRWGVLDGVARHVDPKHMLGPIDAVQGAVIADPVAVAASGVCLEMGRAVAVGDAQLRQAGNDAPRLRETKAAVELQAVRSRRGARAPDDSYCPENYRRRPVE
jgi:hypothetical protein